MERLLMWTVLQIITILTLKIRNFSCQHNQQAATALPTLSAHQDFTKEYLSASNVSPTPQLMNTLLTIAAANGVLPELLPKIQPLQAVENPYSAQELEQRKIVTTPTQQPMVLRHEQYPLAQPISTETFTHAITNTHATAGYEAAAKPMPIVPPIVISPGLNTQAINPFIPPNLELRPQVYQPKEEPCLCSEHSASSPHIQSGPPTLPTININTFDTSWLNVEPVHANSILTTENGVQYPVNLQISIPPPNVEAPRITFINAALPTSTGSDASTDVSSASYNNWLPYGYASQPQQVIVKKRKSPLRDMLPLIIYSMMKKDRGGCRNDGCCCCPCKSRKGGTVPIPYPIPVPVNSPIIGTGYSFHNASSSNSTKNDNHRHHDD